jgi:hypothetical protein
MFLLMLVPCVAAVAIAAHPSLAAHHDRAAKAADADPLIGAWELYAPPVADGVRETKFITASRFGWATWDTTSHKMLTCGGGTCEHQGELFTERLDYAQGPTSSLMGSPLVFRVELHGDTLIQRGIAGSPLPKLYEVWVRVR